MMPVSIVKAGLLFSTAMTTAGIGTGLFVAQIMVGDQSLVGEVVAGGSFGFAVWLVRWSWKVLKEWKEIADADRAEAKNREDRLRTDLDTAWHTIADLRTQLADALHKYDMEHALRLSLEAAGVADRRNSTPIDGTPI